MNEYIDEEQDGAEEKLKKLRKKLSRCEKERKEYLEGWQRARADFQNHIKQKEYEMGEFKKFVADNLLSKIFPILDNLTLAASLTPENLKSDPWVVGITNVKRQLEGILKEEGVEEIKVNKGDDFNPSFHEAIGESESDAESGKISDVVQKGYVLRGKVVRAARVKIAK
ncbi:MAG: nucleotide exchange factor GrpE [Candidatus Spechtbacteria bacterium RIFCSPHIGHO2_02_FULL_43_15b]|uniref:Protein GrpE n=1 Tax=Candidatus Spechtbacteria bacterium RIFCSPHIGHO2_01_FULL_43_30 TaxID=1802158 RepID=A0A1G2H7I9_9BACT|nr:MAG: nucleotide exchange factor GrpE [Candidatus Spechtbacteria bacterium RIFCSPHIGHO2_01_FULL_43_30]OGZ60334.1 MAG: nucleotide exchange factor GrpE [Candidatus Spechtbacteria bacterium RIFCSPHIGHO2_02_FULL_43_15b]